MKEKNMFEQTCKAMGGEYSSEYGMLEPDVGGEHFSEWEAQKMWCTFRNFRTFEKFGSDTEPLPTISVFRAPGVIDIQQGLIRSNNGYDFPGFDIYFREKLDSKNKTMCWKATHPEFAGESIMGVTNVCIETMPDRKIMKLKLDDWGELTKDEVKRMSQKSYLHVDDENRWEGFGKKMIEV